MFLDHSSYKRGNDLYGGDRLQLLFRCALLSKVRQGGQEGVRAGKGRSGVFLLLSHDGARRQVWCYAGQGSALWVAAQRKGEGRYRRATTDVFSLAQHTPKLTTPAVPLPPPALQAALEAVWHVPCGGVAYGDDNCVFIANDWHTALLPVYLQVRAEGYL